MRSGDIVQTHLRHKKRSKSKRNENKAGAHSNRNSINIPGAAPARGSELVLMVAHCGQRERTTRDKFVAVAQC